MKLLQATKPIFYHHLDTTIIKPKVYNSVLFETSTSESIVWKVYLLYFENFSMLMYTFDCLYNAFSTDRLSILINLKWVLLFLIATKFFNMFGDQSGQH